MSTPGVYLVQGSDPTLRSEALRVLVDELVGRDDRSLAVEDFVIPSGTTAPDDGEVGASAAVDDDVDPKLVVVNRACDAAMSPPFLTELRVVVLHEIGALSRKDQYAPIVTYLESPMPTTAFVLVTGGGTAPKPLLDAVKQRGALVRGPESEATADVVSTHARDADLKLAPDARRLITEHLGEDAGRVPALLAVLEAAFGSDATISAAEVEPYLGATGAVPVYELANAIDRGDVPGALDTLHRMLETPSKRDGKPMHPLQVLALLHTHYRRLLRVDDPTITGEKDAHAALGGKGSPYGSKKAWQQARSLGHDGIIRAFDLLARADLDCKGASGATPDTVVELLVARLAGLSRAASGTSTRH